MLPSTEIVFPASIGTSVIVSRGPEVFQAGIVLGENCHRSTNFLSFVYAESVTTPFAAWVGIAMTPEA